MSILVALALLLPTQVRVDDHHLFADLVQILAVHAAAMASHDIPASAIHGRKLDLGKGAGVLCDESEGAKCEQRRDPLTASLGKGSLGRLKMDSAIGTTYTPETLGSALAGRALPKPALTFCGEGFGALGA